MQPLSYTNFQYRRAVHNHILDVNFPLEKEPKPQKLKSPPRCCFWASTMSLPYTKSFWYFEIGADWMGNTTDPLYMLRANVHAVRLLVKGYRLENPSDFLYVKNCTLHCFHVMDFPWQHINQHTLETVKGSLPFYFRLLPHWKTWPRGYTVLDNSIFKREIKHGVTVLNPQMARGYQINTLLRQRLNTSWNLFSLLSTFTTEVPLPLRSRPSATRQWGVCKSNWRARCLLIPIPGPLRGSAKGSLP